jgi:hypothetical protein
MQRRARQGAFATPRAESSALGGAPSGRQDGEVDTQPNIWWWAGGSRPVEAEKGRAGSRHQIEIA